MHLPSYATKPNIGAALTILLGTGIVGMMALRGLAQGGAEGAGQAGALVGCLLLLPLLLLNAQAALYFYLVLSPAYAMLGVRLVLVVVCLLMLVVRYRLTIRFSTLSVPAWIYGALMALSVGWAVDPGVFFEDGLRGENFLTLGLAFFLFAFVIATVVAARPYRLRLLLWAVTFGTTVGAGVMFVNYAAGVTLLDEANRYMSLLRPDIFAGWLMVCGLFTFCQALRSKYALPIRLGLAAWSMILFAAMVLTGTRSAWLGFLVGVLIILWQALRQNLRLAIPVLLVIAAAGLALFFYFPALPSVIAMRFSDSSMASGAGRTDIWADGWQLFAQSPIVGVGWRNFPVAMERFTGTYVAAHNVYLQVLVDFGVIGMGVFLAWMVMLYLKLIRSPFGVLAVALLSAMLVQGFFLQQLDFGYSWLVLGLAEGVRASASRGSARKSEDTAKIPATYKPSALV